MREALCQLRARATHPQNQQAIGILAITNNLRGDIEERLVNFGFVQQNSLRAAFNRLVTELFGLLDGVENRQFSRLQPFIERRDEARIEERISFRLGIADVLHLVPMIAVKTRKHPGAFFLG